MRMTALIVVAFLAGTAWAQVSVEEAEARMLERQRSAATQPTTQPTEDRTAFLQRLLNQVQAENAELRAEIAALKASGAVVKKPEPKKTGIEIGSSLDNVKGWCAANRYELRPTISTEAGSNYDILGTAPQMMSFGGVRGGGSMKIAEASFNTDKKLTVFRRLSVQEQGAWRHSAARSQR